MCLPRGLNWKCAFLSPLPYRLSYLRPNLICKNYVIDWWRTSAVPYSRKDLVSNYSGTFPMWSLHVLLVYLHVLRFPPTVQRPKDVSGGYVNRWMDGDATNEGWDHFPFPNFSILSSKCSCETSIAAWVQFQLYLVHKPPRLILVSWMWTCSSHLHWASAAVMALIGICNRVMFECSPKGGECRWCLQARWPCRELREMAWVWGAGTRQALQTPESLTSSGPWSIQTQRRRTRW